MSKQYKKKTPQEIRQEINHYIDSATQKIDSYLTNQSDINELLDFMSQFHTYSFRNQLLIHDQFDGATAVGSFKSFSDAGFHVNKGEKAIKVLVPTPYNVYEGLDGHIKRYNQTSPEERKLIKENKLPMKKEMAYKLGNVFDISQTNATPADLPNIFPNRQYDFSFEGNEDKMLQTLKDISQQNGVPVQEKPIQTVAKGQYIRRNDGSQLIQLNQRLEPRNKLATLIHEMAHSKLHHAKDGLTTPEREFQAELVSNVVSKHFGLDTDEKSISYIAQWTNNGQDIADKRELIKGVHQTAMSFIEEIHTRYESLDYDQTPILSKEAVKPLSLTKEAIQEAKNVSILDVASFHGIQSYKHSNREYRLTDNKSVAIFTDTNSFYDFAPNSEMKGGSSIDFVQQVLGVTDFKEAVTLLNDPSFERITRQSIEKESYQYDKTKENNTFHRAKNYLVNERGINETLVDNLHDAGYIREDKRGNVLFCWHDNGEIVGCTEQGTIQSDKYERGSWKGIQKNSPSSTHGFNVPFGEPSHLKFFESSIDALSYATLHPKDMTDTWLISLEGIQNGKEDKMLEYVKRSYNKTNQAPKSISVCVDNDSAGHEFWNSLTRIKKDLLTNEIPQKPHGMESVEKWDWNDSLRFLRQDAFSKREGVTLDGGYGR